MLVTRPLLLLVFRSDKGMSPLPLFDVSLLMASGLGETSSLNWDPLHMLPPPPDLHALLKVFGYSGNLFLCIFSHINCYSSFSLGKAERKAFNALTSTAAVLDYMQNQWDLQISPSSNCVAGLWLLQCVLGWPPCYMVQCYPIICFQKNGPQERAKTVEIFASGWHSQAASASFLPNTFRKWYNARSRRGDV